MKEARLLLIDDDVVVLRALSSALASYGQVRFATRAEDALSLLEQEPADLLLVDAEMPGMSGLAFLEAMHRRPGPAPKALLITVHRQPAIEASARLLGAVGVLYKPLTPDAVRASVASALRHPLDGDRPVGLEGLLHDPFRVLVMADDVDAIAPVIDAIASVAGWIEYTDTIEQTLIRAWEESPDAIVITPHLRHLDPVEVTRAVRREPSMLQTPILVLQSPAASSPDELQALQAGASDVVHADASGAVLQARLLNQMRSKRLTEFALRSMRA